VLPASYTRPVLLRADAGAGYMPALAQRADHSKRCNPLGTVSHVCAVPSLVDWARGPTPEGSQCCSHNHKATTTCTKTTQLKRHHHTGHSWAERWAVQATTSSSCAESTHLLLYNLVRHVYMHLGAQAHTTANITPASRPLHTACTHPTPKGSQPGATAVPAWTAMRAAAACAAPSSAHECDWAGSHQRRWVEPPTCK
jgi:hypothetical protein